MGSSSPSTWRAAAGPIGDTVIAATDLLRAQRPEAIDVWCQRVGHRALHHFGGRSLRW